MSAAFFKDLGRLAIKTVNAVINAAILISFLLMLAFGGYALWDSNNIAASAEAKQYEVYKPAADDGLSFQELQRSNSDVFGWLTVYGTPIDYPLVQSEDNVRYINTSVEGEYSLTGAIFLDYSNDNSFRDFNSIIYGHNMVPQVMFGGIKEFKDQGFFDSHKYGNLYYDGKDHGLELFAILEADAYDMETFAPGIEGEEQQQEYLDKIINNAMHTRSLDVSINDRIVLLSTCSNESTNGRDILIGRITTEIYEDEFVTAEPKKELARIDRQNERTYWGVLPQWLLTLLLVLIAFIIVAVICIIIMNNKRKNRPRHG